MMHPALEHESFFHPAPADAPLHDRVHEALKRWPGGGWVQVAALAATLHVDADAIRTHCSLGFRVEGRDATNVPTHRAETWTSLRIA